MRLVAIFLPKGILPHLFGSQHDGLTLNLGGKNQYKISAKENNILVEVISKNESYIPDFFGKDISLVSAIVGRNGIGKTSILRAIHSDGDKRKKNVFYLFEGEEDIYYYYNETDLPDIHSQLELKEITTNALNSVKHYYTPIVNSEQTSILSQLNLVITGEENLQQLYLKQILQDVILLNDPIKATLKTVYPDFPEFRKLGISITKHRKLDFKNVYATTNLGNQDRVDVLKVYIESDIRDLENGKWDSQISKNFIKEALLERYIGIINSSGLNSLFDQLWALEEYKNEDQYNNVHSGDDFIKNFEVTLFSYLILGATFPSTPFQGGFDFDEILNEDSFEKRLDLFLELYLSNVYKIIKDEIRDKLGRISIQDYEAMLDIVRDPRHAKFTQQGFKSSNAVDLMLRHIERFKAFFDFYGLVSEFISEKKFELDNGILIYDMEEHSIKDFNEMVNAYNKVLGLANNYVYGFDLLSIRSDYPLSSGENALLNFFSRINHRINKIISSDRPTFNYYLLLLDEPELGFHPIWKRKFIDAITKSVPVLFGKLQPNKDLFDENSKDYGELKTQIIFSTHDPLTLSDIPIYNVTFIDREMDSENSVFLNQNSDHELSTFGANIHDLLAHSFFLENGFMGEFAEGWIKELIVFLSKDQEYSEAGGEHNVDKKWSKEVAAKLISIIDEPIIKEQLQELYNKKYLYADREELRSKIEEYQQRLQNLDNEEN